MYFYWLILDKTIIKEILVIRLEELLMIIVCDLDGVVFNSEDIVRCQAELTDFIKYKGNGIKIKDKFATYKCYGWSKKR